MSVSSRSSWRRAGKPAVARPTRRTSPHPSTVPSPGRQWRGHHPGIDRQRFIIACCPIHHLRTRPRGRGEKGRTHRCRGSCGRWTRPEVPAHLRRGRRGRGRGRARPGAATTPGGSPKPEPTTTSSAATPAGASRAYPCPSCRWFVVPSFGGRGRPLLQAPRRRRCRRLGRVRACWASCAREVPVVFLECLRRRTLHTGWAQEEDEAADPATGASRYDRMEADARALGSSSRSVRRLSSSSFEASMTSLSLACRPTTRT